MIDPALIAACTPTNVAIGTAREIVRVESGGDPLVLHVNKLDRVLHPRSVDEATGMVRLFEGRGYSVDIGLMQINDRQAVARGLSTRDLLDPCINIRVGGQILTEAYKRALDKEPDGQQALAAALSAYNTGSLVKGFWNGYVARYFVKAKPAPAAPSHHHPSKKIPDSVLQAPMEIEARAGGPLSPPPSD